MSGLRERLHRTTLRTRLIAVLLTCLLISCAAVAIATTVALHGFLQDRLDQQLGLAGRRNSGFLQRHVPGNPGGIPFGLVLGQPVGTLGAELTGRTVTSFGVVGTDPITASSFDKAQAVLAGIGASPSPQTVTLPGLGSYRVVALPTPSGTVVITGLPERPVDDTVNHLLIIELVVFAVALSITGLAAAGCVRLSLRPLTQVAATAEQVSQSQLASGEVELPAAVPNPAPGTEAGQVADAFNRMLAHVADALRFRHASEDRLRRFVADASHELRTPVAIIRSHAEFAQRDGAATPQEVAHSLARISAQSDRMTGLVDDLLLLARLDSGRALGREPVDLTRLVLDAVRDAQVASPDHKWQLDLPDEPVTVVGDEPTLHQAVGNLLANAGTHTPAGTVVAVSLDPTCDGVRLAVADDGPGIPVELRPRLFERFVHGTRAGPDARRGGAGGGASRSASGGYGLGLPIVAAIVAAHRGRLELASPGSRTGGTEFRITLPVAL